MEALQVIQENKDLTETEKRDISLKDIAKAIRQQLKKEFSGCKFSVRTQYYSGGQTLHISIIETNFKIIQPFNELSEEAIFNYTRDRTKEELRQIQESGHFQVGSIYPYEVYNKNVWTIGAFLTEKGFNLIKRITELSDKFNWDNSDTQTDYFDVKFYLNINIGEYDKPLIERI